jgi:hypothetical protein
VHLSPLGKGLAAYVAHRLGAAAPVFEPAAVVELGRLLTGREGKSTAYPLVVDNWLAINLNIGADYGKTITPEEVRDAFREVQKAVQEVKKTVQGAK